MNLGYFGSASVSTLSSDIGSYISMSGTPVGRDQFAWLGWLLGGNSGGPAAAANFHDAYATALATQQHVQALDSSNPAYASLIGSWNNLVAQLISDLTQLGANRRWDQCIIGCTGYTPPRLSLLQSLASDAQTAVNGLANFDYTVQSTVQTVTTQQAQDAAAQLAAAQAAEQEAQARGATAAAQQAHAEAVQAQQQLDALNAQQALIAAQNPTPWAWIIAGLAAASGLAYAFLRKKAPAAPAA